MDVTTAGLIGLVALALLFDFTNGFHDSANAIATVVATHVLRPRMAVAWAAFFNFVAFLIVGTCCAGCCATPTWSPPNADSASPNWPPLPRCPSRTAATMRRRPWA
jgi:PiT family inorganic phosphate transporter